MNTIGVLAQLQDEKDSKLNEASEKDLLGKKVDMSALKNKYRLAMKRKGTAGILKQALMEGASPEELELLRQLKFVRGG